MDRPTVAHIKDAYLPKSETFIYTLLRAHARYRPIVINRYPSQNLDIFPIEPYYTPTRWGGRWASLAERWSLRTLGRSPFVEHVVRKEEAALLHVHFGQVGALFVPVARRAGLPLLVSYYGKDVSVFLPQPRWQPRFRQLWRQGAAHLVLGPHMAEALITHGCPRTRVHILPLPLRVDRIPFHGRSAEPDEPIRLITVGRLIPKKGTDILLRALALLPRTIPYHLWIVGDGPQREGLRHLARSLGLEDRVTFLGWLSHAQVIERMLRAHIFVLPSRTDPETGETEGTPTVLLEAMATGLPVIATRHADIPFIVPEGTAGLLVPEGDVTALAQALDALLNRPDRWPDMGRAGREHVRQQHDVPRVMEQLEAIYDRVRGWEA